MNKLSICKAAVIVAMGVLLQGCGTTYSGAGIRARVIDAETKQAIPGVIVVAHWQLVYPLPIHGTGSRDVELLEAVTDAQGWFQFPAWRSKALPEGVPLYARMSGSSPALYFFRSGYTEILTNDSDRPSSGSVVTSQWDGKTIELERFVGSRLSYASTVGGLLTRLNYREDCYWKKMPQMVIAMDQEAKQLNAEDITHYIRTLGDWEAIGEGSNCGSLQNFLREYKK